VRLFALGLFALRFCLWFEAFWLLMGKAFAFRAFGFLMWEALEGKELLKGKEFLKGNELLKGKCWREIAEEKRIAKEGLIESLYQELYI
jgi:hypothetical protein